MGEKEKKTEEEKMEEKKPEEEKKPAAAAAGEEKKRVSAEGEEKQSKKPAEEKKEEKKTEEIKDGKESKEAKENSTPPPPEIVLKVYMHCEGCARKVRRSLKGFEGVEEVVTDCKTNKVIVKGEKADPIKVLQRVQRKSHRQVELLSPIPKPPSPEEKKLEEKEKPKPEEKKEEPQMITVVLRVHMHCEGCAQEIKKRILRMKEVESAEPDLKTSEVTVKGAFDPQKLVEYVYKRTGKHAVIVKQEPEKKEKEEGKESKEEKKSENGGEKEKKKEEENKEKREGETEGKKEESAIEETKMVELKRNEYYYYPQQPYAMEMTYAYPPQMFSDENPNACSVM